MPFGGIGLVAAGLLASSSALTLRFEANRGQFPEAVCFVAQPPGYQVYLTFNEAVFVLPPHPSPPTPHPSARSGAAEGPTVLRLRLDGANSTPDVRGLDPLPGFVHHYRGSDPTRWVTDIPSYARVRYEQVYPGIDLVYYGQPNGLEYDFVVAPGADPQQIRLSIEGAENIALDSDGSLRLDTTAGAVRFQAPRVYQEGAGGRELVESRFVRDDGPGQIGFRVAAYDRDRPLVIDPEIVFSGYLGGSGNDAATAVAVDERGNIYVTGTTNSPASASP